MKRYRIFVCLISLQILIISGCANRPIDQHGSISEQIEPVFYPLITINKLTLASCYYYLAYGQWPNSINDLTSPPLRVKDGESTLLFSNVASQINYKDLKFKTNFEQMTNGSLFIEVLNSTYSNKASVLLPIPKK